MNVTSRRIQCDEIWSFVYAKEKNKLQNVESAGDVWTWVGIDADTKLVVSWFVGDRSPEAANDFMHDLAARLKNRVQLTTDGLRAYLDAVYDAFDLDIDFAQLVKLYGGSEGTNS